MGWADVAELKESVDVRGQRIDVRKLSLQNIADLIARFPELRKMFETRKLDMDTLLLKAEDAVDAMIATSTGASEEDAAKIKSLALGEKAAFLAKIVKMTMPGGVGPFVELASSFGLTSDDLPAGALSVTNSGGQSPSSENEATTATTS